MNKIIVIGNLGQDAEERTSNSGVKFWTLSIATKETWKDKQGQKQEHTTWHKCMLNGNKENLIPYLRKGQQIAIEGLQRNDRYDFVDNGQPVMHNGKNIKMTSPFIKIQSLELLGSRDSQQAAPAQQQSAPQQNAAPVPQSGSEPMETDNLPF